MINLNNNIKSILAIIVVILGISYFYMCSIRNIKPDPQILIAIVGSLGTVLGYFFGSSVSSSKKDDAIISAATGSTSVTTDVNTGKTTIEQPATTTT